MKTIKRKKLEKIKKKKTIYETLLLTKRNIFILANARWKCTQNTGQLMFKFSLEMRQLSHTETKIWYLIKTDMSPTEGKDKNFKDRLVTLCTYHLFSQNLAVLLLYLITNTKLIFLILSWLRVTYT